MLEVNQKHNYALFYKIFLKKLHVVKYYFKLYLVKSFI